MINKKEVSLMKRIRSIEKSLLTLENFSKIAFIVALLSFYFISFYILFEILEPGGTEGKMLWLN